jgi:hypothetical protein
MGTQESTEAVDATFPATSTAGQWLPWIAGVGLLVVAAWVSGAAAVFVVPGAVFVIGAAALGVSLSYRVRRARVAAARPAAVIYDGLLTDELRQAAGLLGQGPLSGSWMTVALTHDTLEIWGRNRRAPELVVSWEDVIAANPGSATYTRQVHQAVIVKAETAAGPGRLPIVITSSRIIGLPSADRLNGLLASIRSRIRRARAQAD